MVPEISTEAGAERGGSGAGGGKELRHDMGGANGEGQRGDVGVSSRLFSPVRFESDGTTG